jgi:two-component system cell cycle sensor histidine kinase/response regulator CckA
LANLERTPTELTKDEGPKMSTPLRVLIVEDSEDDALLLVRALRRGGYDPTFERVETPTAMTAALDQHTWDVVISDYAMPHFSAPEALTLLKENGFDLPFIIVSGAIGEETAVEAMRAGAHDYIQKGNLARLIPAIERELRDAQVRQKRKQAEEALRESEERYRALFEQSADAIYVTTQEGQVVDLNQAGLDLFGFTREELTEMNASDLYVHPPDRSRFQQEIEQKGFVRDFEVELRKKDGTKMDCVLTSSVQRAGDGTILGYQGIIHDLTEHKRLEEQMRQQDRMAALGQLAGGIAHDFNNILMTIILYAEMLSEEPSLPSDLAPDLESILDEAQEAAHLVRQVLDFSRRSPIETRLVDMRTFVHESVDMLRRTLSENIALLLEVGPGKCVVKADPTRIQQVVMNLVVNARDAMPEGGELRLGLSRLRTRLGDEPPLAEMDAGEWICLAVSDTGTGIPPDVLPRIFEPFFTTKPKGEGTGLGLAQVYGIVKQHRGHVGVETEVGKGTTFRIYLPAQEMQEVAETSQEERAARGKGETILVAEDEEKVRELSRRILESLGYRVLMAANGREALEIYRTTKRACPEQGRGIDLVLTDMVMPEMGGKELIQKLRKENPHLKVAAMTGYVLAEDLQELKEEGSLEIVHKPLDTNTLARVVRHALDGDGEM